MQLVYRSYLWGTHKDSLPYLQIKLFLNTLAWEHQIGILYLHQINDKYETRNRSTAY